MVKTSKDFRFQIHDHSKAYGKILKSNESLIAINSKGLISQIIKICTLVQGPLAETRVQKQSRTNWTLWSEFKIVLDLRSTHIS